ncbi:MAG: hypothetical protein KatS3mg032_2317 [Cyclobacteriaceae bacterium]|nr:MAG: hypothetical protein KatS3mg032_2317 [Cyclobacteriaceae bacterium]
MSGLKKAEAENTIADIFPIRKVKITGAGLTSSPVYFIFILYFTGVIVL